MRKIILGLALSALSTVALAGSMLNITSTTSTDMTKYDGDQNKLTYELTLSLPSTAPTELFLNKIQSNGDVVSASAEPTSSTCTFGLKAPALQPGDSCTVTYQADVPSLTDKSKSQVFNQSFQVLDGLGKTAASPDFKLTVLPKTTAGELSFMQNGSAITSLSLAYNSSGTIVLKNTGDASISGLSVSLPQAIEDGFTSACGATLAAGASCNITYSFSNPTQGSYTLSASGADVATKNLALTVTNQSTLVFQKANSTVTTSTTHAGDTENLTVKNTGNDPAQGFSLSVPPTLDSVVGGSCLSTTTLAAGATCSVVISSLNSQVDVTNNITADASNAAEPVNLAVTINALHQLSFQSGAPLINITQANVSETGSLNLTIKSTDGEAVSGFSLDRGGLQRAIEADTCNVATLPADGCTISFNFDGAWVTPGDYEMRISGDYALSATLDFSVDEEGHFTVKNGSNQIIDNLSAAMSSTNAAVDLTVENTGGSEITQMNVSGSGFSGDCTTSDRSLAAGATCTLTFTPSAVGVSTANISGSNADNSNLTFPVLTYHAWSATQGPEGAQMSSIIKDGSTLYAGVYDNGGVYKSTDGGLNWTHTGGQGIDHEVEAMKQIGTYIYAITLNNNVFVYNTADAEPTWTRIPANYVAGRSLAVDGTTLYAGFGSSTGKVFQLTAGTSSWSQVGGDLPSGAYALAVKDGVLYAGTGNHGVYVYNGTSWQAYGTGLEGTYVRAIANINGELYAAASNQLYKYNTSTGNWDTFGGTVAGGSIYDIDFWMGKILVGCMSGVYDYEAGNWNKIGTTSIWGYRLLVDGSTIYVGSISSIHHGVYKFTDGDADWARVNNGIHATILKGMAMGDTGTLYTAEHIGVDQYAGTPTKTWSEVDPTNQPYNIESLYYGVGSVLYAGTRSAVERYSINEPSPAWTAVGADIDEDTDAMVEFEGMLYSGTDEGKVYKYSGGSWTTVGSAFTSKVVAFANLSNELYAAVYNDGVYKLNGSNWDALNTGLPTSKQLVGLVVFDNKLYAADNTSVYFYDTNLSRWVAVTNSPADILNMNVVNNQLYVLTDANNNESVYRYDGDNGSVWYQMNSGIPAELYGKDIVGNGQAVYLDSYGLGVYQSALS